MIKYDTTDSLANTISEICNDTRINDADWVRSRLADCAKSTETKDMESKMTVKHVEISLMKEGELSIDVQTNPAGNIEIREFEDDEWVGGSYATYENLVEKVKEALEDYKFSDNHTPTKEWQGWKDHGGEG